MCVVKPLPRDLRVWRLRSNAASQGMLLIMLDVKLNAELGARLAGSALANDCQRRTHAVENFLNQGLKPNCLGQIEFQGGHINHPVQSINALLGCAEVQLTTLIAFNVHF